MRTETEVESPTLRLPLLTIPTMKESSSSSSSSSTETLSEYEITETPSLHNTSLTASVPFKWEQEPGKPLPCTAIITKLPSKKKSLDLPPRLQQVGGEGYFGQNTVGGMVLGNERAERRKKGLFGSWGGNKEVVGGSFVFPSDYGGDAQDGGGGVGLKRSRMKRNASFSNLSEMKSHFWVSMLEGLKLVMPWKSKKLKKQNLNL